MFLSDGILHAETKVEFSLYSFTLQNWNRDSIMTAQSKRKTTFDEWIAFY